MSTQMVTGFGPVRIENGRSFTIAGFGGNYDKSNNKQIPELWQRFAPHIGKMPGRIGADTYGVSCHFNERGEFFYIASVEVKETSQLPAHFSRLILNAQRYAVFEHHGQLSGLGHTFERIWKQWLPTSGERAADAPEFERYGDAFDTHSASGIVEIWIPLEPA